MSTRKPTLQKMSVICACLLTVLLGGGISVRAANQQEAIAALEATQAGFHQVQNKVAPAVVMIASTEPATPSDGISFFAFPFPTQQRQPQTMHVYGSGVIIREDGIVLTNSHVVQGATKVSVQLAGSDKALPAKVIQTDTRTDLAILRISGKGPFPTAPLGDAKTVQVGDWAIAFGSPYKLQSTMTVGIISAIGRTIAAESGPYDFYNLIQTDAAINHGNSGGPLVNIHGEVIGINFMIFSPGEDSGSIGIGFAIPIDDATKRVITTLTSGQAVERGQLGAYLGELSDAARESFGVPQGGVLVQSVEPGKAADKAGLKDEDVIIAFNDTKITDRDQFIDLVSNTPPGTTVTLTVMRDKKPQQITVQLGTDKSDVAASDNGTETITEQTAGLAVKTLTPDIARQLNVTTPAGVVVAGVLPGGPADEAGLQRGLVIIRVGQTPVKTEQEFWAALNKQMAVSKVGILLRVTDGQHSMTLTLPQITKDRTADNSPDSTDDSPTN